LKFIDLYVLLLPVIGTIFVLALGRYGSRELRAQTARARKAEQPHTTR
jgi:hypothetical protein